MTGPAPLALPRPAAPGGRPSLERAAAISAAIVEATIDVFAEHGGDFSMDQVAAAAGISKQAIYRRWPGKIELLLHALDVRFAESSAQAAANLPAEPMAALREFAWRMFDTDKTRGHRIGIFMLAETLRNPRVAAAVTEMHARTSDIFRPHIAAVLGERAEAERCVELAGVLQELLSGAAMRLVWARSSAASRRAQFDRRWALFARLLD